MTATVITLKRAAAQRMPMPATRVLSQNARQAFASLKGRVGALDRIFAGAFAAESQAAEILRICEDIRIEAQRVGRLSR